MFIIFLLMFVYMLRGLSHPTIKYKSCKKNISILDWDLPHIRHDIIRLKTILSMIWQKNSWYYKLLKFDLPLPGLHEIQYYTICCKLQVVVCKEESTVDSSCILPNINCVCLWVEIWILRYGRRPKPPQDLNISTSF